MRDPRAGETVGLELLVDGRLIGVTGAVLDGVAPLVREHERDGEVAEVVEELREELCIVVHDEVAAEAVEGVSLRVLVRELLALALRQRDTGSRRDDPVLRYGAVLPAVDLGEGLFQYAWMSAMASFTVDV